MDLGQNTNVSTVSYVEGWVSTRAFLAMPLYKPRAFVTIPTRLPVTAAEPVLCPLIHLLDQADPLEQYTKIPFADVLDA